MTETFVVMAGLDPAIHAVWRMWRLRVLHRVRQCPAVSIFAINRSDAGNEVCGETAWMAGSSPAMTLKSAAWELFPKRQSQS
jgi:hypothetical protein